tara:strand:- start:167 stop:373 length:207 start_codon:yes stop_codon:yes gene_type:complete
MTKKKTKKTEINKAVAEELNGRIEMDRQDQLQELESRLKEIYDRPCAMTTEEQKTVEEIKQEINKLNK